MGRFYKATPAQFIDNKMFELDPQVMMQATKAVNENMTKVEDSFIDELKGLEAEYLEADTDVAKDRLRAYSDEIKGLAQGFYDDATTYKKQGMKMRGLSRKISSDMNTGLLSATKEQVENFKEIKKGVMENKEVSGEVKDYYLKSLEKQYEQAGGISYDEELGTHNKITDFDEPLLKGILDMNKFMNTAGSGFGVETTASSGTPRIATLAGSDQKFKISKSGHIQKTEAPKLKSYMEDLLEAEGYRKSQEQFYKHKYIVDGELTRPTNEDGSYKTDAQLAQEDIDQASDMFATKYTTEKGSITTTATELSKDYRGGGHGPGGSGPTPVIRIDRDMTTVPIPGETNADQKTKKITLTEVDKELNTVFDWDPAVDSKISYAEEQKKLTDLGYTSVEQMYKSTNLAYNFNTVDNLAKGLVVSGQVPANSSAVSRRMFAAEWMEMKWREDNGVSDITSDKPEYSNKQVQTAVANTFSTMSQHTMVDNIVVVDENGVSSSLNANTLEEALNVMDGPVYIKPTSTGPKGTPQPIGSDADGWQKKGGGTIKYPGSAGALAGKNMPMDKILASTRYANQLEKTSAAGEVITDLTENFINLDPKRLKETTIKKYQPDGSFKTEEYYLYTATYFSAPDADTPTGKAGKSKELQVWISKDKITY